MEDKRPKAATQARPTPIPDHVESKPAPDADPFESVLKKSISVHRNLLRKLA